jgi:hypothetical protein
MLQWNSKITTLAILALLVALSAFGGISHDVFTNFTW